VNLATGDGRRLSAELPTLKAESVIPVDLKSGQKLKTLTPAAYLQHIEANSQRFLNVLSSCEPSARVPTCPDWKATDLLWHLARVQWFWGKIVADRPSGPETLDEPEKPDGYPERLTLFETWSDELMCALNKAGATDPAWSWAEEQTVGFTLRRQAHEALIHRLDAELTANAAQMPIDPRLALDGIYEALDVSLKRGSSDTLRASTDLYLQLNVADIGDRLWLRLDRLAEQPAPGSHTGDEAVVRVDEPAARPAAYITGAASAIDAWVWRRANNGLSVEGDLAALERFRTAIR
jgi:hypothetical protein